jgi:hypothetical protein
MAKQKSPLWRLCGFSNSLPLYGLGLDQFGVFVANLVLKQLKMITSWLHVILGLLMVDECHVRLYAIVSFLRYWIQEENCDMKRMDPRN